MAQGITKMKKHKQYAKNVSMDIILNQISNKIVKNVNQDMDHLRKTRIAYYARKVIIQIQIQKVV